MTLKQIVDYVESKNDPNLALIRRERPYRFPKGYMRWESLSALLALCCFDPPTRGTDLATQLNNQRLQLWLVQNAPIYCISTELLRSFEQTDILGAKGLLADLPIALNTFILLFPHSSVKTPEGREIDFCVVHLSDVQHPERSEGRGFGLTVKYIPHEHDRNLHWSAVDSGEAVWFTGMGLEEDGSIMWNEEEQVGMDPTSSEEKVFLKRMRSLILQCLLTLAYKPELVDEMASTSGAARSKPHQGNRSDRPQQWHPRWLGKNYTRPKPSNGKGTHVSPRAHWRRGHWRRAAVGEGRRDRKWVLIEATLVNA